VVAAPVVMDEKPAVALPVPADIQGEEAPCFDRGELLVRLGGGEEMIPRFLDLFLVSASRCLGVLQEAIEAGDPEWVRREAHAMKGAAANISAIRMQRLAASIEAVGRGGGLSGVDELVGRLEAALGEFRDAARGDYSVSSESDR
jgi:HPt (histidine-containing phosphotransfer) domain-containing protein